MELAPTCVASLQHNDSLFWQVLIPKPSSLDRQRFLTPDFSMCILNSMLGHLQVLELDQEMLKLAEQLKDATSLLMFARGFNYATALEAALKVGRDPMLLCNIAGGCDLPHDDDRLLEHQLCQIPSLCLPSSACLDVQILWLASHAQLAVVLLAIRYPTACACMPWSMP